jgi:WD40 repeat protein
MSISPYFYLSDEVKSHLCSVVQARLSLITSCKTQISTLTSSLILKLQSYSTSALRILDQWSEYFLNFCEKEKFTEFEIRTINQILSTTFQACPKSFPDLDYTILNYFNSPFIKQDPVFHSCLVCKEDPKEILETNFGLFLEAHKQPVTCLALTPDEKTIITGSLDRSLRLWDLETRQQIAKINGHKQGVTCVAVSLDGQNFASGSYDCTVKIWEYITLAEKQVFEGHTSGVMSLDFTADSQKVVSGSIDCTIRLWNIESKQMEFVFYEHQSWVNSIKTLKNGHFVSGSKDCTMQIWRLQDKKCVGVLRGHGKAVNCVDVAEAENLIASGSSDWTIKLWSENKPISVMTGHRDEVICVRFMKGKLASGSADKTIRIWNLNSFTTEKVVDGHQRKIFGVVFVNETEKIVTGGGDNAIKIWKARENYKVEEMEGHFEDIVKVCISESLDFAASIGRDKTIRVWDLKGRKEIDVIKNYACAEKRSEEVPIIKNLMFEL